MGDLGQGTTLQPEEEKKATYNWSIFGVLSFCDRKHSNGDVKRKKERKTLEEQHGGVKTLKDS